mmetsp:Transcript_10355/g.18309  ORF Transcript_10355/g.18309 Transcript_10355/m.18309 type:complete len:112 (+) Transcript_10355:116-451(+)
MVERLEIRPNQCMRIGTVCRDFVGNSVELGRGCLHSSALVAFSWPFMFCSSRGMEKGETWDRQSTIFLTSLGSIFYFPRKPKTTQHAYSQEHGTYGREILTSAAKRQGRKN